MEPINTVPLSPIDTIPSLEGCLINTVLKDLEKKILSTNNEAKKIQGKKRKFEEVGQSLEQREVSLNLDGPSPAFKKVRLGFSKPPNDNQIKQAKHYSLPPISSLFNQVNTISNYNRNILSQSSPYQPALSFCQTSVAHPLNSLSNHLLMHLANQVPADPKALQAGTYVPSTKPPMTEEKRLAGKKVSKKRTKTLNMPSNKEIISTVKRVGTISFQNLCEIYFPGLRAKSLWAKCYKLRESGELEGSIRKNLLYLS